MVAELLALPAFAFGVTYLLHSTLLLGGAWFVTRRMDPRALRLRERVWKFAVLGGFLTAGLQLASGVEPLLGRLELALASQAERREVAPESDDVAEVDAHRLAVEAALAALDAEPMAQATPADAAPRAASVPSPAAAPQQVAIPERSAPAPLEVATASPAHTTPARLAQADTQPAIGASVAEPEARGVQHGVLTLEQELPLFALGGWLLAGLASLGLVVFGLGRLRRELAGALELEQGDAVEALERLAARARLTRRVRLLVAPRLAAPLSTGWLRPRICLPPRALDELEPEELEAVLAHEVAHLARRDPPWLFVLWLVESVCFFQPLNRLARRELSSSFELSADAWAARATGDRLALAGCLARIAGWIVGAPRPGAQRALGAAMADSLDADRPRSRLGERILRLLDPDELAHDERAARGELPLGLALLGGLALAVPGAAAVLPGLERAAAERAVEDAEAPEDARESFDLRSAPPPTPVLGPAAPPESERLLPIDSESASEGLFGGLDVEMDALAAELELLRGELAAVDPDPRWSAALEGLESRAQGLEDRRQRMQVVLEAFLAEEASLDPVRFGP